MSSSLLRGLAIAIAVAALIDPVWTASAPAVRELIAIDLTAGISDRMVAALEAAAPRWQVVPRRLTGGRLPCGADERCVAIADGSLDADIPADVGALSMIAVRESGSPNLSLRSAVVSVAHASAAGAVAIGMSRVGGIAATEIRVLDGTAVVGSATHHWGDRQNATIDVPWWPIEVGARTLRIEAVPAFAKAMAGRPAEAESSAIDNVIDVGVVVAADQARVLVFDARPSWSSTFVRRALEDDPRFAVEYRARIAPGLLAALPTVALAKVGALDARVLEAIEAVVVGGPDALTASDVALLDRYVTLRGGSLLLLPEQRPTGAVTRFFGNGWTEQLTPAPQQIGPLRATEILKTDSAPIAAVLGRAGEAPAIVAVPSGHGRVIISGAMDAWRYRDHDAGALALSGVEGFDRFWRSLVAEAAVAGEALRIDIDSAVAARGQRVPFTLRYRTLEDFSAVEGRVSVQCGNAPAAPVRVWPGGALGEFAGELPAVEMGQCRVDATVGNRSAVGFIAIADRPSRGVETTLAKLEHETRARGGVVAEAGGEEAIARALDHSTADSSRIVSTHPMRSAWWILPFAGCLSLEWWLRRRSGLR
jgi:hypothetical protein